MKFRRILLALLVAGVPLVGAIDTAVAAPVNPVMAGDKGDPPRPKPKPGPRDGDD